MKKIILMLFILGVSLTAPAAYENRELLWEADFSSPEALQRWAGYKIANYLPKGGPNNSPAVSFVLPKVGAKLMSIQLDPVKLQGLIQLEAVCRGKELEKGTKHFLGSKIMLSISQDGKKNCPEPLRQYGTYDWRTFSMVQLIPANTESISLTLGIQLASGTFEVASVKIYRCVEVDNPVAVKPPVNLEAQAIPRGPGHGTKYRGFMSGGDMSPEALETLDKWNANLIRYQMSPGRNVKPKADISTPEKYLAWIDSEINRLDELMPLFKKHGIKIVLDLHAGPGTIANEVMSNVLVETTKLDILEEAWRRFARHFRGNPQIYGYDLLNEPVAERYIQGEVDPWYTMSERLAKAIREIDPDTPIITEPNFASTRPLNVKNVIYSPHLYSPHSYTHQGIGARKVKWSYPGIIDGVYWDKDQLRVSMKDAIEFQQKYHVPMFVGEFSVIFDAKGGDQYLKDIIELMEEYGWDWTYHAFRESLIWSLEYERDDSGKSVKSEDNARKRVVLEFLKKNKK